MNCIGGGPPVVKETRQLVSKWDEQQLPSRGMRGASKTAGPENLEAQLRGLGGPISAGSERNYVAKHNTPTSAKILITHPKKKFAGFNLAPERRRRTMGDFFCHKRSALIPSHMRAVQAATGYRPTTVNLRCLEDQRRGAGPLPRVLL